MLKGQLKKDGTLGSPESFGFVTAKAIADRLAKDGTDMSLTIGLSWKNPRTRDKLFTNEAAIAWLNENRRSYTYEACYNGKDGIMHVTALSDNDLF